jgi:anti-sigma B factor antagonist
MELSVKQQSVGGFPVVTVVGEVDVYSAPALKDNIAKLIESGSHTVVVDLTEVAFLDSTGLGALVESRTAATKAGGALPLVCSQERILKLFTITGLDEVFTIHSSIDDAVASLAS